MIILQKIIILENFYNKIWKKGGRTHLWIIFLLLSSPNENFLEWFICLDWKMVFRFRNLSNFILFSIVELVFKFSNFLFILNRETRESNIKQVKHEKFCVQWINSIHRWYQICIQRHFILFANFFGLFFFRKVFVV